MGATASVVVEGTVVGAASAGAVTFFFLLAAGAASAGAVTFFFLLLLLLVACGIKALLPLGPKMVYNFF